MRISTSTLFSSAMGNMNSAETSIVQLQQEISTGKRVTTPSDDPVAAAAAVRVNQMIARGGDLAGNRQNAEASLNTVDTTLSAVNTLLTNVKSTLVAAGGGTLSGADRKTMASQLQGQLQDLLGYANAQDGNGEYLFSGYQSHTQPFATGNFAAATPAASNHGTGSLVAAPTALAAAFPGNGTLTITAYTPPASAGAQPSFTYNVSGLGSADVTGATSTNGQVSVGGATFTLSGAPNPGDSFSLGAQTTQYQGDSGVRSVEVYEGRDLATNLTGAQLFDSVPGGNGVFTTSAGSANSGTGIISQGTVVSNAQLTRDSWQLVFHGPGTVTAAGSNTGSVAVQSGSVSGSPASTDAFQLSFNTSSGSPTYSVLDTTTGTTVTSAQAYTSGSPITVNGVQFTLAGTPASGDHFTVGAGPAGSYDVVDQTTGTTQLSGQTFVAGNAIQFAGMSFSITGAPNAGDTFNVAPSSSQSVFAIMQQAIDALNAAGSGAQGNTVLANALNTANGGIDAAMAQISLGQTAVGGRLQQLQALDTSGAQLKIQYQQTLSTLTDVDMTAAVSSLAQAQVSLTAAQKSFVTVEGLSLFNYIQ